MFTVAEPLARARQAHFNGQFRLAEEVYQQIVRDEPHNADAWCMLALAQQAQGRNREAVRGFRRALRRNPQMAEAHAKLGSALAGLGESEGALAGFRQALQLRPDDAETHYNLGQTLLNLGQIVPAGQHFRQALRYQPRHAEAHTQLGVVLARQGNRAEAAECFRAAVRLRPGDNKAHNNLGVALFELGRREEALACYGEALRLQPDYPEAHFNRAALHFADRKLDEAVAGYREVLRLKPDHAAAMNNLGLALTEAGHFAEAVIVLKQAVRLQPAPAEAHNNLGMALVELAKFAEGIAAYEEALRHKPNYPEAHNNLGTTYAVTGQPEAAMACYQQALWLNPNYAEVRWHKSLTWLQTGDFERGWPEYEFRWRRKRARPHPYLQPLWDGSPFAGRTLILHTEQGVGDTIQFVRYAPLVKERGGRVVLDCPPELVGLLATCRGIDRLRPHGADLAGGDLQAPLLSLPSILRTTLVSIPAEVPYLAAAPERLEFWRQRLQRPGVLKVGIFWQGNPRHRWDRYRSLPLRCFEPLARVAGLRLYSLQRGAGTEQLAAVAGRWPLDDLGSSFEDQMGAFTDAAAVISNLDLVIGCDSALAHLAGSLGVRTWVLLAMMSDWRWLREREDSPWYPSMRLFRQRQLQDWDEVMRRVTCAVADLRSARPAPPTAARLAGLPGELAERFGVPQGETAATNRRGRAQPPEELLGLAHAADLAVELRDRLQASHAKIHSLRAEVRACQAAGDFGAHFVAVAREIFAEEDRREELTRLTNDLEDRN